VLLVAEQTNVNNPSRPLTFLWTATDTLYFIFWLKLKRIFGDQTKD
jgi:hypothetical protein